MSYASMIWDQIRLAKTYARVMPYKQAIALAFAPGKSKEARSYFVRPVNQMVSLRPNTSDLIVLQKVFVAEEYKLPFDVEPDRKSVV